MSGGLDLKLQGGARLIELGKAIKSLGDKGLARRMDAGLRRATQPIPAAVKAEVASTMPKRNGYAPLLEAAITTRVQSRRARYAARVTVVVDAKGKRELRDLTKINQGVLRHPVYGRHRRARGRRVESPWVTQRVKAGAVDRPFAATAPRVQEEMLKVLDETAAAIAAGKAAV